MAINNFAEAQVYCINNPMKALDVEGCTPYPKQIRFNEEANRLEGTSKKLSDGTRRWETVGRVWIPRLAADGVKFKTQIAPEVKALIEALGPNLAPKIETLLRHLKLI